MAKELHNIELSIAALGRSVFLGQLYSADSEVFHPTPPCWKEQSNVDNHTVKESHAITTVEYSDVQSLSDRAKVLDVSGEISISVMSGALSLKGSAKYLDSDSEKLSSREATVSSTLTQEVKRLTFKAGDLSNERYKQIKGTHATHVVTQIVYGGRVLAVFKESKTDSDKTKDISGEFSVEAVKKAGSKFSLEGEFKGKSEDRDLINKQDISVKVYADARLKNTPNTVVEALELVSTWSKTVQENGDLKDFKGVPLHITLTPLNRFIDTSVEMRVLNALAKAELDDIIKTYNGIVSLQGKRSALTSALEERRNLFPTLRQKSSEANEELENDVLLARQRLAEYMTAYRTGKPQEGSETVPSVANFLQGISKSMVNHRRLFLEHEEEYRRLEVLEFSATKGKAPLGDADALNTQMATGPGAIGLVIIPENFDSNSLQNMYRVALNRILAWREKEDKALADETAASSSDPRVKRAGDQKYKTEFLSFYADPLVTESLLRLNGDNQTLAQALSASRVDKRPLFVYFDFIIKNGRVFEKMEWSLLGHTGWSFIMNPKEATSYVGEAKEGQPHGRGSIIYADRSTYSGSFWAGQRDGSGDSSQHGPGAVFINDHFTKDAVVVEVRIMKGNALTGFYKFPFLQTASAESVVHAVASKLDWKNDSFYHLELRPKSGGPSTGVQTRGSKITPQYQHSASNMWDLSKSDLRVHL